MEKNSDTIIGIQIELSHNRKGMETFSDKVTISYNISENVREIPRENLKIKDVCSNFHRYSGMHTNTIRM